VAELMKGPDQGWDKTKPYRIYSRWVKALDRSNKSVYAAIQEAYQAGQPAEADAPGPCDCPAIRAQLDAAITAATPLAGGQVRKRLNQLRQALDEGDEMRRLQAARKEARRG